MLELWIVIQGILVYPLYVIGSILELLSENGLGIYVTNKTQLLILLYGYVLLVYVIGIIPYLIIFKKIDVPLINCLKPFYRTFLVGDIIAGKGYRRVFTQTVPHMIFLLGLYMYNVGNVSGYETERDALI